MVAISAITSWFCGGHCIGGTARRFGKMAGGCGGLDEAAVLVALEGHDPPSSRRCTLITVTADHGLPVGVGTPRRLSSVAMPRADRWDSSVKTGRSFSVRALAASTILTVLGRMPPSFLPWALKAARSVIARAQAS